MQTESQRGAIEDKYYDNILDAHLSQYDEPEYTKSDMAEARDNAVDYVLGTTSVIDDICCGEYGDNARLFAIMANIAISHGSNLAYWVAQYKDELEEKLVKLIDARYEIELENLYD